MDILSHLPFLSSKTQPQNDAVDLSDDELEAQAKAERKSFHRDRVRNGPARFKLPSTGDIRRAAHRDLDRSSRKARREQLKRYHQAQRLAATARGQLQLAGVIPFIVDRELDREQQVLSTAWLVRHFGRETTDEHGNPTGHVSFKHDDVLAALSEALEFYSKTTGDYGLQIPADYVVPIYEDDRS